MIPDILREYRKETKQLALALKWTDIYHWLVAYGYFPESYVLPPCSKVVRRPRNPRLFHRIRHHKFSPALRPRECCTINFPKSGLTDRTFAIMHPEIHNDIAYHIARNWRTIVECLIPNDSDVACYSFPIPITSKHPGRVGHVRSGRMIYEFLVMTEDDLASLAHKYTHILRADIRNFYPSIYTHSISWAIHGKKRIRRGNNRHDLAFFGNRLDRLFQYANDQKTNGIPIGPVVSDIVSEIIVSAVDRKFTRAVRQGGIDCVMTRFKDDYRILMKDEVDGTKVIRHLQLALKEYDLELADEKCSLQELPAGLFRPWVSAYHAVYPRSRSFFPWREFRELYLAVLRIDDEHPGTGVIDRFLADIVSKSGNLKVRFGPRTLQKVISMLLMLGNRRLKAFPKVLAIIEAILRSTIGQQHTDSIVSYLEDYLRHLLLDEPKNAYLISWIAYFLVSNNLKSSLTFSRAPTNPIARSVFNNRGNIFKEAKDFKLFEGCRTAAKSNTMLEYLDVFNPPRAT